MKNVNKSTGSRRNEGKIFEDDFKASVPKDVYYLRLHDSSIGFDIKHSTQRFSLKSPYDAVLCRNGQMYALELKSHKGKSIPYAQKSSGIKEDQVENLIKAENAGAVAGLVLNYRDLEETYFIDAIRFHEHVKETGKKSFSIDEARELGTLIPARKKKVHYEYDMSVFL